MTGMLALCSLSYGQSCSDNVCQPSKQASNDELFYALTAYQRATNTSLVSGPAVVEDKCKSTLLHDKA